MEIEEIFTRISIKNMVSEMELTACKGEVMQ